MHGIAPRRMLPALALAAAALLAAGCLGPDAYLPRARDAGHARFDAGTGALQGLVVSVTYEPLEGARLTLVPGGRTATTNADGSFALDYVEPGRFILRADQDGYAPYEKRVKVDAGQGLFVFYVLDLAADRRPRADALHRTAYIACGLGLGISSTACGATDETHATSVDVPVAANLTTFELRAAWNGTAAPGLGNASLRFTLNDADGDLVDNWTSHGNATGHRLRLDAGRPAGNWTLDVAPAEGQATDAWTDAAGLLVGLRVDLEMTLAYNGYALADPGAPPETATD